jgi:hypothetical protein
MADLLHAGRVERLPPGEGDIDIRSILRHMPRTYQWHWRPVALEADCTGGADDAYDSRGGDRSGRAPRTPSGCSRLSSSPAMSLDQNGSAHGRIRSALPVRTPSDPEPNPHRAS